MVAGEPFGLRLHRHERDADQRDVALGLLRFYLAAVGPDSDVRDFVIKDDGCLVKVARLCDADAGFHHEVEDPPAFVVEAVKGTGGKQFF